MNELALFAGACGVLGGKLLGWRTVCAVEREAYAAQVLAQRQNDGILRPFPIWSDVTTFDGKPWRGIVDVVSGGFPCQDISCAGKGVGINGDRSGLWAEMARIIGEVRPQYVFVENSPMLTIRGLGTVLRDLASLGFDAEWGVLSSSDVDGDILRERIWIVALDQKKRPKQSAQMLQQKRLPRKFRGISGEERIRRIDQPVVLRGVDEIPNRLDRCFSIGNSQDARVAATAFNLLRERLDRG